MVSRTCAHGVSIALAICVFVFLAAEGADATVVAPLLPSQTPGPCAQKTQRGAQIVHDPAVVEEILEEEDDDETLKLFRALHGMTTATQQKTAFVPPLGAPIKATEPATCFVERAPLQPERDNRAQAQKHEPNMLLGGMDNLKSMLTKIPRSLPGNVVAGLLGLCANINGFGVNLNANAAGQGFNPLGVRGANAADWPPPRDGKKRVLFLLSDTGGGHKASAKAIKGALDILYPGRFTCEIEDMWTDHGKWPFNQMVSGYQWLARHKVGNWMWKVMYEGSQLPPNRWVAGQIGMARNGGGFEAYMRAYDPDIVVSVHPLCQDVPLRILDRIGGGKRKVPFVTVVTDLGSASTLWFHKAVDKCCVPGDVCEKIALRKGLKAAQIKKHGLPVRQGFWEAGNRRATSADTKAKLGLEQVLTVLVMGGGDGVGPMQAIAQNVGEKLGSLEGKYQMIVVCGKNEKVQKALKSREWPANVKVVVNGFVSNMDDWMVAADLMVTKAGPGTIAEASIVGLPCMLSGFLPGQEEGNVPYVINAGFGDFSRDPKKIAGKVTDWLADPAVISKMSRTASEVGVTHAKATKEIAREIAELVL